MYDYGARFYDPVLGRFPSLDPLANKFEWVSPYNYAENRPINGIDLYGLQFSPSFTSGAINARETANSIKNWKVKPESQAIGRRIFSDGAMISGGLLLTVASAGFASPVLAATGIFSELMELLLVPLN